MGLSKQFQDLVICRQAHILEFSKILEFYKGNSYDEDSVGKMEEMTLLSGRGWSTSPYCGFFIAFIAPYTMVLTTLMEELYNKVLCQGAV